MFSMKETIRVAVLTKESNSWPTYDGGHLKRYEFVTASEAGVCVRRLAFQKQREAGSTPVPDYWATMDDHEFQARMDLMADDDKRGIFERGHNVEAWVVARLSEMLGPNEQLACVGNGQRSFYSKKLRVSGTPDGIFIDHESQTFNVMEIKSSDNLMASPRSSHVSQLLVNMGLINHLRSRGDEYILSAIPEHYVMEPGCLLYVNPSNYLTMSEFHVPYDNGIELAMAADKAKRLFKVSKLNGMVEAIAEPDTLAPEGLLTYTGCLFCEHKGECLAIEEAKKHQATAQKLNELLGRVHRELPAMPKFSQDEPMEKVLRIIADYDAYNKAEKDAAAHKAALRDSLLEWAKEQPRMKVEFEDNGRLFKVSVSSSERAGSIETDKLEAFLSAHNESLANFRKGPSQVETLLVSVNPVTV